jgi:formate C-acetyltransferase
MSAMSLTSRAKKLVERISATDRSICWERAHLITEAYRENEFQPIIIKRARALEKILFNMPIYILEDELIVGNQGCKPKGAPVFPEFGTWMEAQLDSIDKRPVYSFKIDEKTRDMLRRSLVYWKGKTVEDLGITLLPEDTKKIFYEHDNPIIATLFLRNGIGHVASNYEKVLRLGFNGIRKQIEEKIKELNPSDPENFEKLTWYQATLIVIDAVINFAKRYARLARELAETRYKGTKRESELLEIAEICERVPANPAQTFREALQSFWFTHLIIQIESDGLAISPGRMDLYLYPYYKRDISKGILTEEEAREYLQSLWIKFNELVKVNEPPKGKIYGGVTMSQMVTLGGVDENGKDVTNELSYMILEVDKDVAMEQPSLCVRVHEQTPEDFLIRAIDLIKTTGKPFFVNDHVVIPALLSLGVPLKDARNYAIVGCEEPSPVGNAYTLSNAAYLNLAKILEIVLRELKDKSDISFQEILEHFFEKLKYYIRHMVIMINTWSLAHQHLVPTPYLSLLIDNCLEKGVDVSRGGALYNWTGVQAIGLADVVDSLIAIKKAVYEDRIVSLRELIDILDKNFEGYESLRSKLLSYPKYGNDIDEVDVLAAEIARIYCNEVSRYRNPMGGLFRPGMFSVAAHASAGVVTGALPSGRKANEPLANNISPVHELSGPTAEARSIAKIDQFIISNGTALTITFHPSMIRTKEDILKLVKFIRTFMRLNNFGIGLNLITPEVLREAQRFPERYQGLLVRVSGYSARFVDLPRELQEEVIRRYAHE